MVKGNDLEYVRVRVTTSWWCQNPVCLDENGDEDNEVVIEQGGIVICKFCGTKYKAYILA